MPMENLSKLEPNEEEQLSSFDNQFNSESKKTAFKVRPWIDGDYAEKCAIHLLTQFALYKCMFSDCVFSTDDEDVWRVHMAQHMKLIDVLDANGVLSNERRKNHYIKFRDCPYCGIGLKSNLGVTQHIEEEHRRSIFQCMHCFYRTIEMDNMVLHCEQFHACKRRELLVCDRKREFEDRDKEILDEGLHQYLQHFKCGMRHSICVLMNFLKFEQKYINFY